VDGGIGGIFVVLGAGLALLALFYPREVEALGKTQRLAAYLFIWATVSSGILIAFRWHAGTIGTVSVPASVAGMLWVFNEHIVKKADAAIRLKRATLQRLGELLERGKVIRDKYLYKQPTADGLTEFHEWHTETRTVIETGLGPEYLARFESDAGLKIPRSGTTGSILFDAIDNRLTRIEAFMGELGGNLFT
jgi:hypothetical protein